MQCIESPLEPVAPTFDIQVSIPLINRTKYLSELTSKDTLLKVTPDGGYIYASSQTLAPMGIAPLNVNPRPTSDLVTIGTFLIVAPAPVGDTLTYKEITGMDPPALPTSTPLQTFSVPAMTTAPAASLENATLESGTISLIIRNKLPVAIDFPDPIIIGNNRTTGAIDTNEIARLAFAGKTLQPGDIDTTSASLANETVQNSFRVPAFRMHLQASTGPVTIAPSSGIEYVVTFSNLVARSAKAQIPPKGASKANIFDFIVDDSLTLQSAYFRSGSLDLVLQNNVDLDANVTFRFNELLDRRTGTGFTFNTTFHGKGVVRIPIDAADVTVQSSSSDIGTRVSFYASIESIESQVLRQVNRTDNLMVTLQPQTAFIVHSITGRIKPTSFAVNSGASGPNFGDVSNKFTGTVNFDSVNITLKVSMASGFPTDYNLRLVAMNRRASPTQIDSLIIPPPVGSTQTRFYPGPGSITQIMLNNSSGLNKFFSRFFPNFPDTFIVRGSALMNPPDIFPTSQGIQTIYDTSKVYTSIDVSFPLKLALAQGEIADTVTIENSQKLSKDLEKSVKSATMYFEVTNGLPIQVSFRAALLRKSAFGKPDTLLWLPADGPRTIAAASVDQGGSVIAPKTSPFSIGLMESEAEKINDADAIWYKIQIETTGGGTVAVKFRQQDFVTVRASANMVCTMNKQ